MKTPQADELARAAITALQSTFGNKIGALPKATWAHMESFLKACFSNDNQAVARAYLELPPEHQYSLDMALCDVIERLYELKRVVSPLSPRLPVAVASGRCKSKRAPRPRKMSDKRRPRK